MAPVAEERAAMVLETSDATATATEAEGAPRAQTNNVRVLKLAAAAAAAALAAGALVATSVAAAGAASRSAPQASDVVELAQYGIAFAKKHDTGCSNWDQIMIKKVTAKDMADCVQQCAETAECANANFQDEPQDQCTPAGEGADPGTCYLYRKGCNEEVNKCWSLAFVGRATPANYTDGMGCSNWDTIYFDKSNQTTRDECAKRCNAMTGCVEFNFQYLPDTSCTPSGEGSGQGTCYLYNAPCAREPNGCWSLGSVLLPDSPTTYAEGTGCSNWDQIQIDRSTQATRMECAQRCKDTAACVAMNFQGLPNGQCTPQGEGAGQNVCLLYKGCCLEEPNSCWALGNMFAGSCGAATTTITTVTTANGPGTSGTTVGSTTTQDVASTTV